MGRRGERETREYKETHNRQGRQVFARKYFCSLSLPFTHYASLFHDFARGILLRTVFSTPYSNRQEPHYFCRLKYLTTPSGFSLQSTHPLPDGQRHLGVLVLGNYKEKRKEVGLVAERNMCCWWGIGRANPERSGGAKPEVLVHLGLLSS